MAYNADTIPATRSWNALRMGIVGGAAACLIALSIGAPAVPAYADEDLYTIPDTAQSDDAEDPDAADQDGSDASADAQGEQLEVDILNEELKQAQSDSITASVKAAGIQQKAQLLEALVPEQQARSDEAARRLYKNEQDKFEIAEIMLSSQSLEEFIQLSEYFEQITKANTTEINNLKALNAEIEKARQQVDGIKAAAAQRVAAASDSLKDAQRLRAERASAGIALAQQQAGSMGGTTIEEAGNSSNGGAIVPIAETDPLNDGADWYASREDFIAEWAPRIDNYFKGTPLAGQGENFATSAYKYCIDPRWSAAISNTESSKGRVCIRPHNAWGWGAADSDPYNLAAEWDTWEEAIDAHARGLAKSYGYTITMSGAQVYCPYTWQSWYNRTLTEMAKI